MKKKKPEENEARGVEMLWLMFLMIVVMVAGLILAHDMFPWAYDISNRAEMAAEKNAHGYECFFQQVFAPDRAYCCNENVSC